MSDWHARSITSEQLNRDRGENWVRKQASCSCSGCGRRRTGGRWPQHGTVSQSRRRAPRPPRSALQPPPHFTLQVIPPVAILPSVSLQLQSSYTWQLRNDFFLSKKKKKPKIGSHGAFVSHWCSKLWSKFFGFPELDLSGGLRVPHSVEERLGPISICLSPDFPSFLFLPAPPRDH